MSPRSSVLPRSRLLPATLAVGVLLTAIFGLMLTRFRAELSKEIQRTVIGRDAAVLYPVVHQQIAPAEGAAVNAADLLPVVLQGARQEGVLGVAVFDSTGGLVRALPSTLLFAELAANDYLALLGGGPISRYHAAFPLGQYFAGAGADASAPVLEVLIPLEDRRAHGARLGFAQYYLDARALSTELALIEARLSRQTTVTMLLGTGLLALVLFSAYLGLRRANRRIAERNEHLARANFELTLAAKASALGQITSHLIHGLQGSVAGLRAVVTANASSEPDWRSAADYTDRMQTMINEIVGLLGDTSAGVAYELDGRELAAIIRARNAPVATRHGVRLSVDSRFNNRIDGHRGGLLCLIASNLISNAAAVTPAGREIAVKLTAERDRIVLTVADEGPGIAPGVRERLFEPGATNREGGTGLGLAISRLLARQIGGDLELVSTGPHGTVFRVPMPRRQ